MSDISIGEQIAKVVAEDFTDGLFSLRGCDIAFRYHALPTITLQQLRSAFASVREIDEQITRVSRSQTQHEYFVEICLRRQVDYDKSEYISGIKSVMQSVREHYLSHSLTGRNERFQRADNVKVLDDADFNELQVVKATVTLVFRGFKEF